MPIVSQKVLERVEKVRIFKIYRLPSGNYVTGKARGAKRWNTAQN